MGGWDDVRGLAADMRFFFLYYPATYTVNAGFFKASSSVLRVRFYKLFSFT